MLEDVIDRPHANYSIKATYLLKDNSEINTIILTCQWYMDYLAGLNSYLR